MLNKLKAELTTYLETLKDHHEKIETINQLRQTLHTHSPFKNEPVDCVLWVKAERVAANDYNPNVMAPAEKQLLKRSIEADGFTQPIVVSATENDYQVVDGFHRHLLGKSRSCVAVRLHHYLPVTCVNASRQGEAERIAATIRHNRARGKHQIASMSDIVRDLARLGWEESKIGEELGMDADEVLRLKQISGLAEMFDSEPWSDAWTVK